MLSEAELRQFNFSATARRPLSKCAVLIIGFRRPDLILQLARIVSAANPSRIYVSIDGARPGVVGESARVAEVIEVVGQFAWSSPLLMRTAEANLGAGVHVKSAIDWFFEAEPHGIILEDDCHPNPSFFDYANFMLDNPPANVMSVAGFYPAPVKVGDAAPAVRSRYPMTWGWATWASEWRKYKFQLGDWRRELSPAALFEIGRGEPWFVRYWSERFDNLSTGNRNIWDYQWVFAVWANGGRGVFPRRNLIENVGFGKESTHSFIRRRVYATPSTDLRVDWRPGMEVELQDGRDLDSFLHLRFYHVGKAYPATSLARKVGRTAINKFLR